MHIIIINASPNSNENRQTSQIVKAFYDGIVEEGKEAEIYLLSHRKQWHDTIRSITYNQNIVFVVPVYLGTIPSLLKEFLEKLDASLPDEKRCEKNISFVLQSAFPEASQRRCAENHLETFVKHLKCSFSGILSHGVYYGLMESKNTENLAESYYHFGKQYIKNNATFFFKEATDFNGVEYLTDQQAKKFVRGFNFMCKLGADEYGATDDLYRNPYENI